MWRHLSKGRLVAVTARLEPTTWKAADDSTRYGMEIIASTVEFLEAPRQQSGAHEDRAPQETTAA